MLNFSAMSMLSVILSIAAVVITSSPLLVGATWSIDATDNVTLQVGGAGASCVLGESIYDALYHAVPGKGVLHAQAVLQEDTSPPIVIALELLGNETNPSDIIDVITGDKVDPGDITDGFPYNQMRQYGIVDIQGGAAGYTGSKLAQFYEVLTIFDTAQVDTQGSTGNSFTYSAQGNVVTNVTVPSVEMGFVGLPEKGTGCDLADRLMIAVEAGGIEGGGDKRCITEFDTPAAGGFLHVDNPDGTVLVHIDIVGNGTVNPLLELREQYDEWRAMNPCPGATGPTFAPASSPSASPVATPTMTSGARPSASPVATPTMTSGAREICVNKWSMRLMWVSFLVLA
jgi:hypothetical protein